MEIRTLSPRAHQLYREARRLIDRMGAVEPSAQSVRIVESANRRATRRADHAYRTATVSPWVQRAQANALPAKEYAR